MPRRGAAVAVALLLLGVALAAAGCGLGPGSKVGSVDLTVTRDFGAKKLVEASGEANESDTVMRFLEGETEIETRYGGGYVKSIDGLEESERGGHPYDWFFWVNGVISPTGAAEVPLEGGEKIWWDIHNWAASEGSPAVVGSWPAPFTTGWEGHEAGVALECHDGRGACGGVTKGLEREGVEIKDPRWAGPRIVVGPWAKLRGTPVGELLEEGPGESGVYASFERSGGVWRVVGLDEEGKAARAFPAEGGLVAEAPRLAGPPVWIVTGGTSNAVRAAAVALDIGARDLRDHFAVAS